jgi:hypothetical protein
MKIAGITVVALLMVSSAALSGDYEAREFHACAKSLEQWEETHGRKVEETMARLGAFSERVIVWDSGARVRATVGATSDGRFCVLASRFLGRDVATAAQ